MNRPKYSNAVTKLATVPQAVERYKLGRTLLMQFAEGENAVRRIGRAVRIDVEVLDEAVRRQNER